MGPRQVVLRLRREWAWAGGLAGMFLHYFRRYTPAVPPLREMTALERARWAELVEQGSRWLEDLGTDWWTPEEEADWLAELEALGRTMPLPTRPVPTPTQSHSD